ncbi:MAG: glycosyltransferase family 2 protein [Pseudomonadota bacterium]|nr:glycosyltransferase family 2 protein [Pseudomonadota bacterium]
MSARKLFVLLPAYNEAQALEILIPKICSQADRLDLDFCLVICNDGSTDETQSILESLRHSYPIHVLNHSINRGLGETSRDLFEYAATNLDDEDIIIRMDCDDTHDPEVFEKFIEKLQDYDIVVASRFQEGGGQLGVPNHRAGISLVANTVMKIFFPISGVREYSCGYRAYRASIVRQAVSHFGNNFIQLKGLGFTCTVEKLIKFKILNARICEVPFTLKYNQKIGESKMVGSATTFGYFALLLLYYWPWGGWRNQYKKILVENKKGRSSSLVEVSKNL